MANTPRQNGIINDTILKQVATMKAAPNNVRFLELKHLCDTVFGQPRVNGSHHYYKTPWQGDPRICIQNKDGKAKPYQVRDVVRAVERLGGMGDE